MMSTTRTTEELANTGSLGVHSDFLGTSGDLHHFGEFTIPDTLLYGAAGSTNI